MSASTTSDLTPPPPPSHKAKRSWWKIILVILLLLAILVAGLWWWYNRAIQPINLGADEKAILDKKLEAISPGFGHADTNTAASSSELDASETAPAYEKGKKEFEITERELNGLLNEHTKFGDQLSFELVPGAVHARIATDLEEGMPLVGGKKLKARARFFIETRDGIPELILDDLTVWGISLPNDWLGGMKGQNLLGEVFGSGETSLAGIESLVIERGRLIIRLAD
ncbi:MAG: hypothetical protein ACI9NC_005681 [Verrucomicrobiales bacterium]|jgi:hypothetical protein